MLAVGDRAVVWPQNPVRLPGNTEPQPDAALLRPPRARYALQHPRPGDVVLLVEVADTSYRYDRGTKLPLYARAGAPEVWILDLEYDAAEVHRQPGERGYASSLRVECGGVLVPQALSDVALVLDDALLAR